MKFALGYPEPSFALVWGKIINMYYVYVLRSETGKLYVGRTSDLRRRIHEHLSKKNHTTSRFGFLKLIFYEAFSAKEDSIRRERYLKTSPGKKSLKLILRESIMA